MRVLLSIKPEFALKIFDGSKRYEYRRSIFKRGGVTKIVVYASDPIQKVIGEFKIIRGILPCPGCQVFGSRLMVARWLEGRG